MLLDEPLAAMGAKEAAAIVEVIAELRARTSMSMILVAHNHAHVMELCDRVNVIEDGRIALDKPASQSSIEELMNRMTARSTERRHPDGQVGEGEAV